MAELQRHGVVDNFCSPGRKFLQSRVQLRRQAARVPA